MDTPTGPGHTPKPRLVQIQIDRRLLALLGLVALALFGWFFVVPRLFNKHTEAAADGGVQAAPLPTAPNEKSEPPASAQEDQSSAAKLLGAIAEKLAEAPKAESPQSASATKEDPWSHDTLRVFLDFLGTQKVDPGTGWYAPGRELKTEVVNGERVKRESGDPVAVNPLLYGYGVLGFDPKYQDAGIDHNPRALDGLVPGQRVIDDPFELMRLQEEKKKLGEGAEIVADEKGKLSVQKVPPTPDAPAPTLSDAALLASYKALAAVNGAKLLEALTFNITHGQRSADIPYYVFAFDKPPGYIEKYSSLNRALHEPIPGWEWQQVPQGRYLLLHPDITDRQTSAVKQAFLLYFRAH